MHIYNLDLAPCKLTPHSKGRIAYGVIYDVDAPNKCMPCIACTSYEDILISKIKDASVHVYRISSDGRTYATDDAAYYDGFFSYFVVPREIDTSRALAFYDENYSYALKKMIEEEYKPFLSNYSITIDKNK